MVTIKPSYKNNKYVKKIISPKTIYQFMKRAKEENADSINVILDYKLEEDNITNRIFGYSKAKTVYEAMVESKTKVRLIQTFPKLSQLEAIANTGHQVDWLEKQLPDTLIQFKNDNGEDMEKIYSLMLELAKKMLPDRNLPKYESFK